MSISTLKIYCCTTLGVVGSFIVKLLGGWSEEMSTLIIFMAVDYVMGLVVAGVFKNSNKSKSGSLDSRIGWKGLCKKCTTFLFVILSKRLDLLLDTNYILTATVIGFIAEVGDISRFDNPKQLQKLAGYAIVSNSSGKHNGESHISYRGRKRLRYVLYEAAISLVGKNAEFKEIHNYYLTRDNNPLKKMQSIIAVACKVIRIFYAILTKGIDYDGNKMLQDIVRPSVA